MADVDWDKLYGRAGGTKQTKPDPQADFEKTKTDFIKRASAKAPIAAPVASPPAVATPILETIGNEVDNVRKNLVQFAYGRAANAYEAFGQTEKAAQMNKIVEFNSPAGLAPEFGEVPGGRFLANSAIQGGADLGVSVGLAFIPVVGVPLAIGDMVLQQFGESRGLIRKETGKDNPLAAVVPAAINSALDLAAPARLLKNLGLDNIFKSKAGDKVLADIKSGFMAKMKNVSLETASVSTIEALTEGTQYVVNLATVRALKEENMLGRLNPQEKTELWGNFWGGFAGGAAAGAIVSGYSEFRQAGQVRDIEKTIQEDGKILDMIQADKLPEKMPYMSQAEAGASIIAEAKNNIDPAKRFVFDESNIVDPAIAFNQRIEMAEEIKTLPEVERTIAVEALKDAIRNLQTEVDSLRELTSAEKDTSIIKYENNFRNSRRFYNPDIPYSESFPDGLHYFLKDGVVHTSAVTFNQLGDLDLADGMLVSNDTSSSTLDVNSLEIVDQAYTLLKDLKLDINPVSGRPMRVIFKVMDRNTAPDYDGELRIIDNSTLEITVRNTDTMSETFMHELGHLTVSNTMIDLSGEQLTKLHEMWLRDISSVRIRSQYYAQFSQSYMGYKGAKSRIRETDKTGIGSTYYKTSLQEYLADMFSRAAYDKVDRDSVKENGFDLVYKKFYRNLAKLYVALKNSSPENRKILPDNIRDFVQFASRTRELAAKQQELAQLERDIEASSKKDEVDNSMSDKEQRIYKKEGNVYTSGLPTIPQDSDMNKIVNFIDRLGLHKEADNVREVVGLNMGFLGTGVGGSIMTSVMTPLQVAEQSDKKGFNWPVKYMEFIQAFHETKMKIIEKADTILRSWTGLGKAGTDRVSRMLYLVSTKSDELKRRLNEAEVGIIATQVKAPEAEVQEWAKIDSFMLTVIDDLQNSMTYEAAKIYIEDSSLAREFRDAYVAAESKQEQERLIEQYTGRPIIDLSTDGDLTNPLWDALTSIKGQTDTMRNRNYYPRSRLGEYAVRITGRIKGATFDNTVAKTDNETLAFYAFDTQVEQEAFMDSMKNDLDPDVKILGYKMSSEVFAMMGMPVGLIDQLKRDIPNLSSDQIKQLNDISLDKAPGRRFLRHLTKRRGIAGYSEDALRVFANYATSAANHTAKAEWASDLGVVLNEMEKLATSSDADAANTNDLRVITDYYKRHLDYMFKPDNDWARLRAIGFVYYLGYNVKSAVVNIMQTPMVLYPVLAAHTSDANAIRRITGAMKDAVKVMRGSTALPQDEMDMLQHMVEAGLIDESMVSVLAGMAEADALKRLVPGMDLKSKFDKFAHGAGFMFRVGEKYNRYIAAIAAFRIAKDNGMSGDAAIKFTRDTIQASQFEYSRWNRAEFMRGKKSVLFLFWQYMQHATYLLAGGKGRQTAARMWLLALLIAGLEGLPFAEFVLDFLDFGGTQIKKLLGDPNPRVSLRSDLREIITEFTDKPDILLKGSSYFYGLGPLHAASLLGVPVPQTSTRGSLSYGNPVPWFDGLTDPTITSGQQAFAKTIAAVAGPVGGIGLGMVDALMSTDPNNWKRWEKILPLFARNASTGVRWAVDGEETDSSNGTVLTFTTPEQRAETIIKSLGFQPTRVDQTRQQIRAAQVAVLYQQVRRQSLLKQLDYAYATNNREGTADVIAAIMEYNKSLMGSPGMASYVIKSSAISRSVRAKAVIRAEKGIGMRQGKEGYLLEQEMKKLYPITAGEKDGTN